jgi:hypothetical protein
MRISSEVHVMAESQVEEEKRFDFNTLWQALAIKDKFIERQQDKIKERLLEASGNLAKNADLVNPMFAPSCDLAMLQSRHIASSVVLLGSDDEKILSLRERIRNKDAFAKLDPTSVITVATLMYLLDRFTTDGDLEESEKLKELRQRFDDTNWGLNPKAIRELETPRS